MGVFARSAWVLLTFDLSMKVLSGSEMTATETCFTVEGHLEAAQVRIQITPVAGLMKIRV